METLEKLAENPSLSKRVWKFKAADERQVLTLAQRHDLPPMVARLLVARGVSAEDAEDFLNPSLKASLPDPGHLLDMDKAVKRLATAIEQGEKIAVFGDYDVDGATSSALLKRYFRVLGSEITIYIPDRMKEGYGPNAPALLKLKEQGHAIAITVDCGTLAFEALEAADKAGLEVIVLDHHQGEAAKPKAHAVVNPNRLDETSPLRQLAAVGVCFLLCVALNRELRARKFFEKRREPDLFALLDLVALGTICDVVPLTGLNRALVTQGLKVMQARANLGIRALLEVARVDESPAVYHAGFIVGPRVNAGGRVGESSLGATILSTEDEAEAKAIALILDRYNSERKTIEQNVLEEAISQAEQLSNAPIIIVHAKGWHAGVIGIVASRLKDRFGKPALVIAFDGEIGKASARSVSGFDLGGAVIAARAAGLLVAGGGHAMAAGFTIEKDKLDAFSVFMFERFLSAGVPTESALWLDGTISLSGATVPLVEALERAGPFGSGNPTPKIKLERVRVISAERVKEEHVRLIVTDPAGQGRASAMAFRAGNTAYATALLGLTGKIVDLAVTLKINRWMGKESVQFVIEDVA